MGEALKCPFWFGPSVASNQICNQPISLVDIYPTCIDYAEMSAPHTLDGNSIKPLLIIPSMVFGQEILIHFWHPKYGYTQNSVAIPALFSRSIIT